MSENRNLNYSFWNGKNLDGKQEYADFTGDQFCQQCEFKCAIGTETVSADDL